ncbi:MAG: transcriptional regulator algP [Betaproteobacteria bacterium]|nr:transcriptional regulator algP [Betaproteobacteria bacterium]
MRFLPRLFSTLRRASRLIWVVLAALMLQPLALARQPAAVWISLPYCASAAADHDASARSAQPARHSPSQPHAHSLLVLLNPAAAVTASAQAALPAPDTSALPSKAGGVAQCPAYRAAPYAAAPPHSPQQPRAPPRFS